MKKAHLLVLCLILFFFAQAQQPDSSHAARPRVGVVLGGGGAKGAAHIGVLKYMEELGIPVDYITGTSMGSIMGGMYALGYSADELADLIASLNWSVYMRNSIDRRYMSIANKQNGRSYQLIMPFGADVIKEELKGRRTKRLPLISTLPSAFVGGSHLINLFNNLSVGYQDSISFDSLPIPFACVATDLLTGDGVVLREGRFAQAIRSSMAIPGVFSPVAMGDKLLVDGGLANNFPVDVCKDMGAEIIIGSEVADEMMTDPNAYYSLPQLLSQLMNVLVKGDRFENQKLCDLYIHPDISGYNMLSFSHDAIDTLVARGYREAQKYRDEFLAIKQRLDPYGPVGNRLQAEPAVNLYADTIRLSSITMTGISDDEKNWLLNKCDLETGFPITGEDIEKAVSVFLGTGYYSDITYTLQVERHKGDTIKSLRMREEYDWYHINFNFVLAKPHNFSFGFRYDTEESAALGIGVGFNQNRMGGFKALFGLRLCYNPRLSADLSLNARGLGSAHLAMDVRQNTLDVYDYDKLRLSAVTHQVYTQFYFSEFHLRDFSCSVGVDNEYTSFRSAVVNDPNDAFAKQAGTDNNAVGLFARFLFDSKDDEYFPTKGSMSYLDLAWRSNTVRGVPLSETFKESTFGHILFNFQSYFTPNHGSLTIIPQFYSRAVIGESAYPTYYNLVGGTVKGRYFAHHLPYVGIVRLTSVGDMVGIVRCDFDWNIVGNHHLVLKANALRSTSEEYDFFKVSQDDFNDYGFSIGYAFNSLLGPMSLDMNWSRHTHAWSVYASVGYDF